MSCKYMQCQVMTGDFCLGQFMEVYSILLQVISGKAKLGQVSSG
jgi:hypothetical protein